MKRHLVLALATALGVSACGGGGGADGEPLAQPSPAAATSGSAPGCTKAPLARRAAATLVVGLVGDTTEQQQALGRRLVDLGVSGLFLRPVRGSSEAEVTALLAGLRERAGRPLAVSTDEESGRVSIFRAFLGPSDSPRTMARTRTVAQVREHAAQVGRTLARIGVDLDLAPSLDLNDGPSGAVIGDRSFSADPERATDYGLAFAAGLADSGVTPVVKHFPGQGRSQANTDRMPGRTSTSVAQLRASDLVPFQAAIDAGAPVVMMTHLQIDGVDPTLPVSMSPKGYALLRSMGFTGVAMTDSLGANAVNRLFDFPEAAVRTLVAGGDAVLATDGTKAVRMRDAIVRAVRSGRLPEARLDEAAARVTALVGGDQVAVSCVRAVRPTLRVAG